jgi:potassium channel subfamily K, other eukaryote
MIGDLYPTTLTGKLFTILFGLSGISILGAAIATIGSRLVETEQAMILKVHDISRKRISTLLQVQQQQQQKVKQTKTTKKNMVKTPATTATDTTSTTNTTTNSDDSSNIEVVIPLSTFWRQSSVVKLLQNSIPALSVLVIGGLLMGRWEGWNVWDSIYYAFITAGTLGYGDFAPKSRPGRMMAIVFIPLAVAAAGTVLGAVATTLLQHKQSQVYQTLLSRPLNINRLVEMDTNRNGQVSREEYVAYMLQELQLVTSDQLQEIYTQFDVLDVDGGGYLDSNDLQVRLQEINNDRTIRMEE